MMMYYLPPVLNEDVLFTSHFEQGCTIYLLFCMRMYYLPPVLHDDVLFTSSFVRGCTIYLPFCMRMYYLPPVVASVWFSSPRCLAEARLSAVASLIPSSSNYQQPAPTSENITSNINLADWLNEV